jgi:hypothetical protein
MLEKHAYALVKSLKAFMVYVLQSSITTYFLAAVSKRFWSSQTVKGREGNGLSNCWNMTCTSSPPSLLRGRDFPSYY